MAQRRDASGPRALRVQDEMEHADRKLAAWLGDPRYLWPCQVEQGESNMALLILWEVQHGRTFPAAVDGDNTAARLASFSRRLRDRVLRDDVLRELSYTARIFTGEEGKAHGFVTHVTADPLTDAMALAREIAGKNPDAIRGMKRLANAAQYESAEALLMAESVEQDAVIRTPNQREAVMANFEKRAPVFVDPEPLKA